MDQNDEEMPTLVSEARAAEGIKLSRIAADDFQLSSLAWLKANHELDDESSVSDDISSNESSEDNEELENKIKSTNSKWGDKRKLSTRERAKMKEAKSLRQSELEMFDIDDKLEHGKKKRRQNKRQLDEDSDEDESDENLKRKKSEKAKKEEFVWETAARERREAEEAEKKAKRKAKLQKKLSDLSESDITPDEDELLDDDSDEEGNGLLSSEEESDMNSNDAPLSEESKEGDDLSELLGGVELDGDWKSFVQRTIKKSKRTKEAVKDHVSITKMVKEKKMKSLRTGDEDLKHNGRRRGMQELLGDDNSNEVDTLLHGITKNTDRSESESDQQSKASKKSLKGKGRNEDELNELYDEIAYSGDEDDSSNGSDKRKQQKKAGTSRVLTGTRKERRAHLQLEYAKTHPEAAALMALQKMEKSTADRRNLTYEILTNKGDRKYYKKDRRNPRVFHRHRYEKAQKRLHGRIPAMKEKRHSYGGEETGINQRVVKSIKL
ncbi:putative U3 small nucleolar RNA-associated protein 3 [Monocercomonoides exilis]|uniref:putative U3 small nucleolar RNA-associated protein 3 n=1 Tax=Monocercomonoides exilis TaxID=2049356 RepID=UPI00355A4948|nr:putative U3 small nucleolar RNA-associated protein 3 [Monocercomonoides exilis]|eukprot:MONOS_11287.1-p1 / transcript=MONOS_11287.1 / gene=MONOS_11287 / organism=Monocercomonoides_exilis_PA203 / gene_product=unspecified product / transcript_product=unspecified product / location=Mono_scaffold00559:1693-3400(-) / protein_length=493 / sequence_SO=supercontig / SO=protein_coding / is_pseudo=false